MMEEELSKPLLSQSEPPLERIRLLSLNLFLRPPLVKNNTSDYKDARTEYFSSHFMDNYDILCLQEIFATMNSRRSKLIQSAISKGILYSAYSPAPSF